jgi:flagellar protein FlgJ
MSNLPASSTLAAQSFASGSIPQPGKTKNTAETSKAAEDFEAFFLTQMLEHMFKGVPTDGYFGGGYGEGVYRSLMLKEYGKILAKSGGIGMAHMVNRELMRLQEAQ